MVSIPPEMEAQRMFENEALALGEERLRLQDATAANITQILDGFDKAHEIGVPIEEYAKLVKVRRQELYRWRKVRAYLKEEAPGGS
jgi:hypothetical protein